MRKKRTCLWHVGNLFKAGLIASVLITSTVHAGEQEIRPVVISIEPIGISVSDLDLLSRCVMAEASNQGEQGMAYVADVILNRVDSEDFPDSIEGVITQKYQFSSYRDGGMNRHEPSEECIDICLQEYERRQNEKILYFRTGRYHKGRTDAFKHREHYFSY